MFHSFARLVSLGLVLGTWTSPAAATSFQDLMPRQSTCAPLHMMIAGGCSIPCPYDEISLLETLVHNITAAFPGADQYIVPYDDSEYQAMVSTPLMIAAANSYFTTCPNTPVVFIGYSLGGIIVMNTLCGGLSYTPNVIAAITYGEETFRYPEPYDAGTCTNSAPLYPRNNTAQCAPFSPAIQNYCDATDPKCCVGGTGPYAHFAYPALYDVAATNFIKSRYASYELSSSSSSSVASSTATSTSTSTDPPTTASTTTVSTTTDSTTTVSTTTASTGTATTTTVSGTASTTTVSDSVSTTTTVSTGTVSTTYIWTNGTTTTGTAASTPSTGGSSSTSASGSGASTGSATDSATGSATGSAQTTGATTASASGASAGTTTATISTTLSSWSPPATTVENPIPNSAILYPSSVLESLFPSSVLASLFPTMSGTISGVGATGTYSAATGSGSAASSGAESGSAAGSAATGTTTAASGAATGAASGTASASVASYTGGASRLPMPGMVYFQWLCRAWKGVASIMAV